MEVSKKKKCYKNFLNFSFFFILPFFKKKKFINKTNKLNQKNSCKFFMYYIFFFFYYFNKEFNNLQIKLNFLKTSKNTLNFLKSPNRFKMARNQLFFCKSKVKLLIMFFTDAPVNNFFFYSQSVNFFQQFSCLESNFMYLNNFKFLFSSLNFNLNFFN